MEFACCGTSREQDRCPASRGVKMPEKLYESQAERCDCGGRWRVLYEVASFGGSSYYPAKCPVSDSTTGIHGMASSAGAWRLQHQLGDADVWTDIRDRDREAQEAFEKGGTPSTSNL